MAVSATSPRSSESGRRARFLHQPPAVNRGLLVGAVAVAGAAAGVATGVGASDASAAALGAAALAVACDRPRLRLAAALAAGAALAAAHGAHARASVLASPLTAWLDARAGLDAERAVDPVEIDGTLVADAALTDSGASLLIRVASVRPAGEPARAITGVVQAHVAGTLAGERVAHWTAGRRIAAPAAMRRPQVFLNPGAPSETWQRLRRPFDLVATIKSAALVRVEPGHWWDEWAAAARRRVRRAAAAHVAPFSTQAAAIVTAILIGDRAGLSQEVQRRLQAAGTYHVIAISGGNVAILVGTLLVVLRVLVRSPRVVAVTTLVGVAGYGWIVGGDASVTRAVTAAIVYLTVGLAGLTPPALNVLGCVGALVVVLDPLAVIDTGAVLSFGATLGIIVCAGPFLRLVTGAASFGTMKVLRRIWLAVLGLACATAAAELFLLPISAMVFSRVSIAGLVLNFVAIPAMTIVQIGGTIVVIVSVVAPVAASLAGHVAAVAADVLVGSSKAVDAAPWLSWRTPSPPWALVGVFYATLAMALTLRGWRWPRRAAVAGGIVALIAISTALPSAQDEPRAGDLRLSMIDVGQGDCLLVQFPTGHSLLVDTGGVGSGFDIGGRVVAPALWALGVRRLDWLAITHGDADHVGGALSVLSDFRPREIWEGIPVPRNPDLIALRAAAQSRGVVWRDVLAGHFLDVGGARLEVLHPAAPDWERQRVRNDDSIVMRLTFGAVEFLLTGDAGAEFERTLQPAAPNAKLRVVKMGHHGSRSASSARFVAIERPDVAIVSAGRGNLFGHPAPDVLARYTRAGAAIFRTDRDGAVTLETDGRTLRVATATGRRWQFVTQ